MDYSYNYLLQLVQAAASVEFAPALRQVLLRQEEPASVELALARRRRIAPFHRTGRADRLTRPFSGNTDGSLARS